MILTQLNITKALNISTLKLKKLKLQTPCSQNKLSTDIDFKITNKADWEYIYLCKIKLMEDTKQAEFNYKLLNNIL